MNFTLEMTLTEKLTAQHLNKTLNQVEADLDQNVPMSPEFLDDYIGAAIHASKFYGRKGDRVSQAMMMLSEVIK